MQNEEREERAESEDVESEVTDEPEVEQDQEERRSGSGSFLLTLLEGLIRAGSPGWSGKRSGAGNWRNDTRDVYSDGEERES